MRYKYIDLPEFPTIGEVIFPDEPNTVYVNRYALPRFCNFRITLEEEPDNASNNGNSFEKSPSGRGKILKFPRPCKEGTV